MNDDLGIETEENKEDEENKDALLTFVKETLGDKVAEVTRIKETCFTSCLPYGKGRHFI